MKRASHYLCLPVALFCLAQLSAAYAGSNLRYSITVSEFKNEAGWSGKWSVGDGFTTMLTDALQESDNFIVLGDAGMRTAAMAEQDLVASGRMAGGKKAPKVGRMTPAQLLCRGSITHVESGTAGKSGGIGFKGFRIGGKGGSGEVNITIYLVDAETGQVQASQKVVGTSKKRGLSIGYSGSGLGGLTGDLAGFKKDNVGKACQDAVDQAVKFLIGQLENVAWEGTIVLVKPGKILVNRGTREGVTTGMTFQVGEIEEVVDPDTGEVLDSDMTIAGKIEVTSVKEKVAYCKATEGADAIKKGMTVFPAE